MIIPALPFGRTAPLPLLMGILNVTPDSFSDGGKFALLPQALAHATRMMDEGAAIIDIGGESTRPGATPLCAEEEQARILPVFSALRAEAEKRGVMLSVDTRHAATMRAAVAAGAHIINDVSALTHDAASLQVAAQSGCSVVLMHMQGNPQSMQQHPHYENVVEDICAYLDERITAFIAAGGQKERVIIDPGLGFGKTPQHNIEILRGLSAFTRLGVPVLVGASRKSFISAVTGACGAEERLGGSLAAAWAATAGGAKILRVHDVAATRQALQMAAAIGPVASGFTQV